jgi:hypothetical protein
MTRRFPLVAGLLAASLAGAAPAGAQEGNAPSPLSGVVRLHVESPLPAQVTEHLGTSDTKYGRAVITVFEQIRRVCMAPCDTMVDGRSGNAFTVTSPTDDFPEPGAFQLGDRSGDVTLRVEPGSNGRRAAGRWLTVLGGAAFLIGLIAVPLNYTRAVNDGGGFKAVSVGMLLGGPAALGAGIPLLVTSRTRIRLEPRVGSLGLSFY